MRTSREIIDKLNELRKEQGMSITELARQVGMAKSGVSKYFNHTREFPINRAPEFAKALHTTVESILGVDRTSDNIDNTLPINVQGLHKVRIPVVGDIACGEPILADENIEEYRDTYFRTVPSGTLFDVHCKGHSMEPMIPDGAFVTIRKQPTVENDEIAAVLIDDSTTLKKFKRLDKGHIILYPINNSYEPIILDNSQDVEILGKAVHYDGEL